MRRTREHTVGQRQVCLRCTGTIGGREGGVTTMHSPEADTQYACLHVTLQDVHSVGPSEGTLSGSPDAGHTLPDGTGPSGGLATCKPPGCRMAAESGSRFLFTRNSNIQINIQKRFGLGVEKSPLFYKKARKGQAFTMEGQNVTGWAG